ncbi:MAG: flagellar hook-associated protein FlgL [Candidatus Accumulibacter sp.]|jgi:flagellar hook-associated protein 3 FlgL|nr:flagellar hook-associated protein FlgL [Accumulibacter sp.]
MRISTSQIFDAGVNKLMNIQSSLYKTQNQLSSGQRITTAEDDPVGASQVLLDTQSLNVIEQYADNQKNASSHLAFEEDILKSVVEAILYVRERGLAAQNAALSDEQRAYFSVDIQARLDALFALANSRDSNSHYIFSGYEGNVQAFQKQSTGEILYAGDDGQRVLQVDSSRQIAIGDSGRDVFVNNPTGNGVFETGANAANTGSGVIYPSSVNDPSAWTSSKYEIQFTSAAAYDIVDISSMTTIASGVPYTDGAAITGIPGITLSISGQPAVGDVFTVGPSVNRSVFETLRALADAFSVPVSGNPALAAEVRNTVVANMMNLDGALNNVLRVQATVGTRMHELKDLGEIAQDLNVHYQEKISRVRDLDYAEAISRFTKQTTQLEAAQKSFASITSLSLFNYI